MDLLSDLKIMTSCGPKKKLNAFLTAKGGWCNAALFDGVKILITKRPESVREQC
jgi:hypothetical protein